MWPDTTLDQVAAHEAGHAVARMILGVPFAHVEVLGIDNARVVSGSDAKAEWLPGLPANYTVTDAMEAQFDSSHSNDLFDYATTAAAGPVAQMRYEGREPAPDLEQFSLFGGNGDADVVKGYCLVLAATEEDTVRGVVTRKGELVEQIIVAARALVDHNQDWIGMVAAGLMERQTLSRGAVEDLRPELPQPIPPRG